MYETCIILFNFVVYVIIAKTRCLIFLCPRHKMAEGHIEFTLSVCVCVYSRFVFDPNFIVHSGI